MKKVVAMLAVAALGVSVTAQERDLRKSRDVRGNAVSFRAASDQAQRGFDRMTVDGGQVVFVAQKSLFTGSDVSSANVVGGRDGGSVDVSLSGAVAARQVSGLQKTASNRLAIFLDGRLLSAPVIQSPITGDTLTLSGLDSAAARRLVRAIGKVVTRVSEGVVLIPDQRAGKAGDTFLVEVFLMGVNATLRGYQVALDAVGGETGRLELDDIIIDSGHADYVFEGTEGLNATDVASSRMLNALAAGSVDLKDRSYLATFVFKASSDARGDFQITVRGNDETAFVGLNNQRIEVQTTSEPTISIR